MEKRPTLSPAIVQHGTGRTLRAFGEQVTVLLDGSQTGGQFTAFLESTEPGGGPPPHFHEHEDEWFFAQATEAFAQPSGPDMGRAIAIAGNHGIRFVQT